MPTSEMRCDDDNADVSIQRKNFKNVPVLRTNTDRLKLNVALQSIQVSMEKSKLINKNS